jgi:hypothetical protein
MGDRIIFVIFILVFVVARFLGILLHEFGHGLVSLMIGGDFFALYASPGTGLSYVYLEDLSVEQWIFVHIGGLVFQVVAGAFLFMLYPRLKGFLSRIFTLQLLLVLLVYSFLYFGISTAYAGDGASLVFEIERSTGFDATIPIAVINLAIASLIGYFLTKRVLAFLEDYFSLVTKTEAFYTLFFFFSLPLSIGFLGAILAIGIIPFASIQFLIAFLVVANLLFFITSLVITRKRDETDNNRMALGSIAGKESNSVLLSFSIVILLWIACFGPTPSTAHGIILKEPPLAAEKILSDRLALNIKVEIGIDSMEVDVIQRGVMANPSPLENTMWHTFDDRADWPYNENTSIFIVSRLFKSTEWNLVSERIGSEVFGFEEEYENPRIVRLVTTQTDTIFKNSSGKYTLTLFDPWLTGPIRQTENYLHLLNITWDSKYHLVNHSSQPQRAPMSDLSTFLEWKNFERDAAPMFYTLEFVRT